MDYNKIVSEEYMLSRVFICLLLIGMISVPMVYSVRTIKEYREFKKFYPDTPKRLAPVWGWFTATLTYNGINTNEKVVDFLFFVRTREMHSRSNRQIPQIPAIPEVYIHPYTPNLYNHGPEEAFPNQREEYPEMPDRVLEPQQYPRFRKDDCFERLSNNELRRVVENYVREYVRRRHIRK